MNILFTGGGGSGNEALWRVLGDRHRLFFGDADPEAIDPIIPAERRLRLPWANDPAFSNKLLGLCREHNIELIIPCVDEELLALADAANTACPSRIWMPDEKFVRSMLDKHSSARLLREAGLDAPDTALANPGPDLRFPLLMKPRSGRGSRGVAIVQDVEQLKAYLAFHKLPGEQVLAQELLRGQEYTVCVIPDLKGRLRAVIPVKVLIKRGVTLRAYTEAVPAIDAYARRFQEAFSPSGPYNLQGILGEDGRFSVFEVNPRVSTTFCLALAASEDLIALAHDTSSATPEPISFRQPVHLSRHWNNHLRFP